MTGPTSDDPSIDDSDTTPLDVTAELDADATTLEEAVPDVIAALTADVVGDDSAPPLDMAALHQLNKLKAARTRYKRMYDALGPVVAELEAEVVENVMPHRAPDGRWSTTVGDKTGYLSSMIWPKRQVDESTGDPFTTDDLIDALNADQHGHLVARQVNGQSLAAWVRELVDGWAGQHGEDGARNGRGELVDAFGNVLTEEESYDPTAPELGLPPHVRKIISLSTALKISFRAR